MIAKTSVPSAPGWRRHLPVARTALGVGLVVSVVLYGALLRFDALTLNYGPVIRPAWLGAVQESRGASSVLRPRGMTWNPVPLYPHRDGPATHYISDPYTYLRYAREMRSFYAAHRREPLFPFATKVSLWLLHDQDVAVSFASAAFSVLAIFATFLLGWRAFSYSVGLLAALAMAIEYDVVSWGVGGWRDDAFTCAVVLCAWATIRYLRTPNRWNAALVGGVGGLACLVRITSLSFVVPAWFCLLLAKPSGLKARLSGPALAAALSAAIAGPFVLNCWLTFGDPLHAINVHADVYRAAEGQTSGPSQAATQYATAQFRSRPLRTLDTAVLGMTSYPFTNKWRGFDPWLPPLGTWLSWAAIAGLVLLLGSLQGRVLALLLAASLVPYALTWKLIGDWRFTEHAYPFYLVAAALAIVQVSRLAAPSRVRAIRRPRLEVVAAWGAVTVGLAIGWWFVTRTLPALCVEEALRAGEPVTITAGSRDLWFFAEGWSAAVTEGNVTKRTSSAESSVIRLDLPAGRTYDLMLRLDPLPRQFAGGPGAVPAIRVSLNGARLANLEVQEHPQRVGAYDVALPARYVKAGTNRLTLSAEPGDDRADRTGRFAVWYVRIRPR